MTLIGSTQGTLGSEARIFRPSAAAYGRKLGIGGLVIAGLFVTALVVSLASGHWSGRALAIVLGVAALSIAGAAYMINVRVEVSGDEVRVRGMSGMSRAW